MSAAEHRAPPRPRAVAVGDGVRVGLLGGVSRAAELAAATFGPRRGLVLLDRDGRPPEIVSDGERALRDFALAPGIAQCGLELAKAAAKSVFDRHGDGAALTTLLTEALCRDAVQALRSGVDARALDEVLGDVSTQVLAALGACARPTTSEDLFAVARAAGCDAEIARMVTGAIADLGPHAVVKVSYAQGVTDEIEVVRGMSFDHGALSRHFLERAENRTRKLERPFILMSEDRLAGFDDVAPALEIARKAATPLLVLAERVEGAALSGLVANDCNGVAAAVAVKAPGSGLHRRRMTQDLAVLCGGAVFGEGLGRSPRSLQASDLGRCDLAIVGHANTELVGGHGDPDELARHLARLRDAVAVETGTYDRGKLETRIARLSAGVTNIRVGGRTDSEWKARYWSAENSVKAAKSAVVSGVVPGGGTALAAAAQRLRAANPRNKLRGRFARAFETPFRRVADQLGLDGASMLDRLADQGDADDLLRGLACATNAGPHAAEPHDMVAAAVVASVSTARALAAVGAVVS